MRWSNVTGLWEKGQAPAGLAVQSAEPYIGVTQRYTGVLLNTGPREIAGYYDSGFMPVVGELYMSDEYGRLATINFDNIDSRLTNISQLAMLESRFNQPYKPQMLTPISGIDAIVSEWGITKKFLKNLIVEPMKLYTQKQDGMLTDTPMKTAGYIDGLELTMPVLNSLTQAKNPIRPGMKLTIARADWGVITPAQGNTPAVRDKRCLFGFLQEAAQGQVVVATVSETCQFARTARDNNKTDAVVFVRFNKDNLSVMQ
jgi:hypothetical protein